MSAIVASAVLPIYPVSDKIHLIVAKHSLYLAFAAAKVSSDASGNPKNLGPITLKKRYPPICSYNLMMQMQIIIDSCTNSEVFRVPLIVKI